MLNPSASTQLYRTSALPQAEQSRGTTRSGSERVNASDNRSNARDELNVQILQASAEVSLKAGDQSQTLLFRSAIERINELLSPTLGPDAIQAKMGDDNSPEATAERIVSLSTGFFDAYAAQHPDDDPGQLAKDFVELIRGGFEKGFNEAKDILQGLKVFGGDIESGVMKTYELVSKGYDEFLASKLGGGQPTKNPDDA
ncbi:DUF5610 domain-containing protein [Dechloromonas sp. A34]|uniref:DUF5610 domain-containing protein n=1 Tax=Dechloromonas sp. A34 TaxID=447588 RepID=UPI002248C405|nr:DUF5610 domain-containing protein [Dechloromonas sp. A34]